MEQMNIFTVYILNISVLLYSWVGFYTSTGNFDLSASDGSTCRPTVENAFDHKEIRRTVLWFASERDHPSHGLQHCSDSLVCCLWVSHSKTPWKLQRILVHLSVSIDNPFSLDGLHLLFLLCLLCPSQSHSALHVFDPRCYLDSVQPILPKDIRHFVYRYKSNQIDGTQSFGGFRTFLY